MDKWKTICSQALLDTKWVKVRKDAVELPNETLQVPDPWY